MYYVPPTLKIKTSRSFVGTDCLCVKKFSCTLTPCGLLGGIQRSESVLRSSSVYVRLSPWRWRQHASMTTVPTETTTRHKNTEYRIFEHTASWTPQFLHHWLPEPYQWFVLVMHRMCFQGGINAPLKYYLDSLRANKTKQNIFKLQLISN
jgi:hypothetical protein